MPYHSQYLQDKWLNENIFRGALHNIYLDIGAHDGITINNTYFFAEELGWCGVCIEPVPSIYEKLQLNRQSAININAAIWTEDSIKKFQVIEGYSEMLSGLSDQYDPRHAQRIKEEIKQFNQTSYEIDVPCIGINNLLSKLIPFGCELHLLSIDTEGSEGAILKSIAYDKYDIHVIVVENNFGDQDIRHFLNGKNYQMVARLEGDDIWRKRG